MFMIVIYLRMSLNSALAASYLADLLGFVSQPNLPGYLAKIPQRLDLCKNQLSNRSKLRGIHSAGNKVTLVFL